MSRLGAILVAVLGAWTFAPLPRPKTTARPPAPPSAGNSMYAASCAGTRMRSGGKRSRRRANVSEARSNRVQARASSSRRSDTSSVRRRRSSNVWHPRRFLFAFYERFLESGDAHGALRETRLEFAASDDPTLAAPATWAGFVVVGRVARR